MSDDLPAAFDLQARARAMASPDPLDRISLRDHVVEAEIGAFEAERGVTQRLRFDIVVEVLPAGDAPTGLSDDVDRILSYDRLAEAVAAELQAQRLALLETLADHVAARILREPQAVQVFLRIQKLDRGPGDLGVEIVRSRGQVPPGQPAPEAPRPRMVLIGPNDQSLARLIEEAGAPLLLCAIPSTPPPPAATEPAQRRISLLALDQAAWALASRDPRLLVAGSRTELDWALRRAHPAVWAPARVVLDAPDAPDRTDMGALAAWLARHLDATSLTLSDGTPQPVGEGARA